MTDQRNRWLEHRIRLLEADADRMEQRGFTGAAESCRKEIAALREEQPK